MLVKACQKAIAPDQPMSWVEAIIVSSMALCAAIPGIAGIYLVKSALGINLIDGPSPLHDLLYHFAS